MTVSTQATRALLADLPTLTEVMTDDLKIQSPTARVWLSRLNPEDGAPKDPVTFEAYDSVNDQWTPIEYNRNVLEALVKDAVKDVNFVSSLPRGLKRGKRGAGATPQAAEMRRYLETTALVETKDTPSMAMTRVKPASHDRRVGPMKISVTGPRDGVTIIHFSAALRDALKPSRGATAGTYRELQPKLWVYLLTDPDSAKFAIQRAGDEDPEAFEARGMSMSASTAYITGWALAEASGFENGHYLVTEGPELTFNGDRAEFTAPVPRKKKTS